MGAFTKGTVVLIPFPFSDLSEAKLRPALVLAHAGKSDLILCQITSKSYTDPDAIELNDHSFRVGSLKRVSYARPCKLFTASESLIISTIGQLKDQSLSLIIESIIQNLRKA